MLKAFRVFLWLGGFALVLAIGASVPIKTILTQAPLHPSAEDFPRPVETSSLDQARSELQHSLFGLYPKEIYLKQRRNRMIDTDILSGTATLREIEYEVSFGGGTALFHLAIVTPNTKPDAPIILSQNFCSNAAVINDTRLTPPANSGFDCSGGGALEGIFKVFFGRYITTPPLKDIIAEGYAFAALHPPEFLPDRAQPGRDGLLELYPKGQTNTGALMSWAAVSVAIAEQMKREIPTRPIMAMGHSRYGKTALLASAYGDAIDGAIAHQSGTAGASTIRDKTGETLADILKAYPHWLSPAALEFAETPNSLTVDAQHLLALSAPKPIFLGNARRDVWSDPVGAFKAAKSSSGVWGGKALTAQSLDEFKPDDHIAFWMRPGTHGVVKEDWPAFLAFLDAHFN